MNLSILVNNGYYSKVFAFFMKNIKYHIQFIIHCLFNLRGILYVELIIKGKNGYKLPMSKHIY